MSLNLYFFSVLFVHHYLTLSHLFWPVHCLSIEIRFWLSLYYLQITLSLCISWFNHYCNIMSVGSVMFLGQPICCNRWKMYFVKTNNAIPAILFTMWVVINTISSRDRGVGVGVLGVDLNVWWQALEVYRKVWMGGGSFQNWQAKKGNLASE